MSESADIERGRILFAQECRFLRPIVSLDDVPDTALPEVAFVGRSNVGKSSLLNALTTRAGLARVSNTPGRTREINLFDLGHRLILVDLPGYGFARVSKSESAAWRRLLKGYLQGRPQLARVCVLIDSRHGVKESDEEMMSLLDGAAVSFHAVLTKADKIPEAEAQDVLNATTAAVAKHTAGHPDLFLTSATTSAGLSELRAALADVALPPESGYKPATAGKDRA